jgi:hypothetical protein
MIYGLYSQSYLFLMFMLSAVLSVWSALFFNALNWWTPTPSPPTEYVIHTEAGFSSRLFKLILRRSAGQVHIVVGRFDSTARAQDHDQELQKILRQAPRLHRFSKKKADQRVRRALTLFDQYQRYTLDSLTVTEARQPAFLALIDSVYLASTTSLEDKEKNYITLDGHTVRVRMWGGRQPARDFYVANPSDHSLIYRLIHGSMELYRLQQPNLFRTRRATLGY